MDFQIANNILERYIGDQTEVVVPDGIVSIADSAFCMSKYPITQIALPGTLKRIGCWVFQCMPIKEIFIPDSVESIDGCAFNKCPELETVSLPASAALETSTFYDCPKLKTIIFRGENMVLKHYPVTKCRALNRVITTEKNLRILQEYMPGNVKYFTADGTQILTPQQKEKAEKKSMLKKAIVSAAKASSDDVAMLEGINKKASVIVLPSGLKVIPAEAFKDCTALEKIVFSAEIQSVEARAFSGCTSLKQVVLSDSLNSIASSAFQKCKEITLVVGNANAIKLAKAAIKGYIHFLTLPKAQTDFESDLFSEIEKTVSLYDLLIYAGETDYNVKYAENGKTAPDILLTYIRYAYTSQVSALPDCNKDNYSRVTITLEKKPLADKIAGVLDHESMMKALKKYIPEFSFAYIEQPYGDRYETEFKIEKKSVFAGEPLVALIKKARNMANGDIPESMYDSFEIINQPANVIPYVHFASTEELSTLEKTYEIWSNSSLFNTARKNARVHLLAVAKVGMQSVVLARSTMGLNEKRSGDG